MTDYPEYQHRFRSTRACPTLGHGSKAQITVDACLHHLRGNARPYFSVTAMVYNPGARDCESCGCLHEAVLKYWPELAPVVALHLSDDAGEPMYATANGWYQLAGYYQTTDRYHAGNSQRHCPIPAELLDPAKPWQTSEYRNPTPEECLASFAEYVRISIEDARELADGWRCADDWASSRRWYTRWVQTQAPRWQAEADAAVALLDDLIARQAARKAAKEGDPTSV